MQRRDIRIGTAAGVNGHDNRGWAARMLAVVAIAAAAPAAFAQTPPPPAGAENPELLRPRSGTTTRTFWTADRVLQAVPRPLPQPKASATPSPRAAPAPVAPQELRQEDGTPPTSDDRPQTGNRLFPAGRAGEIRPRQEATPATRAVRPHDAGNKQAFFSSSRLIPISARLEYPYRATGKVFFLDVDDMKEYVCSAAVIQPRLVLTAGHCVHKGSGGSQGYHTRILFVPAYHSGQAPFQAWTYTWVIATASWQSSNGEVPNKADLAIIEVEDREIGGDTKTLGEVVGWFGYRTGALLPNHTKKIGYPVALDNGQVMHQVDSQSFEADTPHTVLYGSDMTGGSSGGPWIENFGVKAAGQDGGLQPHPNRIVGVTSYGYIDPGPKVQGSSVLGDEFLQILRIACARKSDNCKTSD